MPCYSETELAFLESRCAPLQSVTTEGWKFIETTRAELYDLTVDPGEVRNLAEDEPARVQELRDVLGKMREKMTPASAASVNLTPDEKRILASLGYAAGAGDGDVAAAIEMIRKILDDAPRYSTARLFLGDLLLRQKQFDGAAKEYAAVASDQPDNAEAHAYWANALAAQGHFEDAAAHYRKAIEIDPTGAAYHYYFSFTLIRLGNSKAAIDQLQDAIRCNPAFVEARLQLGRLLAENGQAGDAAQQYEAALKYRPGLPLPSWISNRKHSARP
jgi:tetratricopeptide (TPR) repeat protein